MVEVGRRVWDGGWSVSESADRVAASGSELQVSDAMRPTPLGKRAATLAASALESLERSCDVLEAMTAGQGSTRRRLPAFDYADLIEAGVRPTVLADAAFASIVTEAADLGAQGPVEAAPVLFEMRDPLEYERIHQVTIVRTGTEALARRSLFPETQEVLVVLNGPLSEERLEQLQAVVSGICTDMKEVQRAVGAEGALRVAVAVGVRSVDEVLEQRRLVAALKGARPRVDVEVARDWPAAWGGTERLHEPRTERGMSL